MGQVPVLRWEAPCLPEHVVPCIPPGLFQVDPPEVQVALLAQASRLVLVPVSRPVLVHRVPVERRVRLLLAVRPQGCVLHALANAVADSVTRR